MFLKACIRKKRTSRAKPWEHFFAQTIIGKNHAIRAAPQTRSRTHNGISHSCLRHVEDRMIRGMLIKVHVNIATK